MKNDNYKEPKYYNDFDLTQLQMRLLDTLYFDRFATDREVNIKVMIDEVKELTGEFKDREAMASHVKSLLGKG
ncbi:TPA: hypothetical protein ACXK4S_000677 [Pseudomonas aeruginosa]